MKRNTYDIVFDSIIFAIVTFAVVITAYPFLYVFSMSISSPEAVLRNEIFLLPKGFSLTSYKKVFEYSLIWTSYYNTVWYTVIGTLFNVFFTIIAAYPLSKEKFFARNFFTFIIVFTMLFSGGLIPTFILVTKLGLYGTRWAMVIPGLISVWNLVITRTFFQSLPEELFESARLEGCSEFKIIKEIVLPLSAPIIAVLVLYYGVSHWNSFVPALLYLRNIKLHPLQVILRKIVIQNSPDVLNSFNTAQTGDDNYAMLQVKYSVIMVAILPIITLYPFLQKYFVKGVLIGALKG